MKKDPNYIASIEKAISEKYGEEAIQNPKGNWDEIKEKEYLQQMKELYRKAKRIEESQEKVDVNGIKVSKKLLNRDAAQYCPVCSSSIRKAADDVCLIKFKCCSTCYIEYIEGREERWLNGWRPNKKEEI
jgi:phosphopantetheine adenylyltransferase|tara:strand:+ start:2396 stop:2785 length:390 start_codon:yes stop_codon:yes gene_type:complete